MIKGGKAPVYQIHALDLMIEARTSQSGEIGLKCHSVVVSDGIESGQAKDLV